MSIYGISGDAVSGVYDIDGNLISEECVPSSGYLTRPEYKTIDNNNYRLVWCDEFDEKDLDRNSWTDMYYISNVENRYQAQADYYIQDSILNIRCKKDMPSRFPIDDPNGNPPTARNSIQSGEYNGTYVAREQYHDIHPFWGLLTQEGYYEMRLKPWKATSGCCNVWWCMGIQDAIHQKAKMDGRGEIDVIEFLQKNPTILPHGQHPNADTSITNRYNDTNVGIDLTNDFHTIGFLWEDGTYKWYLDGNLVDTMSGLTTITYPVFHIISAYKIISGGDSDWKGPADTSLNNRDVEFKIDYLRIYKKAKTVATEDVTIKDYNPIVIDANTADMEIDPDRGCPYQFPSFCYVNWSDGTRTEHWVKWDAIRDTYQTQMTNQNNFDWSGYVYGLGISVKASVHYQKTMSILGDSISTFDGYIPSQYISYYHGTTWGQSWTVNDTWWMKVASTLGYSLEVNNSAGATMVSDPTNNPESNAGCQNRSTSLGAPDIIVVYMGINDFGMAIPIGSYNVNSMNPSDASTFKEAYSLMLSKIKNKYPSAKVLCCKLLQSEYDGGKKQSPGYNSANISITTYNNAIAEVATAYGADVVALDECGITWNNRSTYMIDYVSSTKVGVHPNKSGMTLVANSVMSVINSN